MEDAGSVLGLRARTDGMEDGGSVLGLRARTTARAVCPQCGNALRRVQVGHVRRLADLPLAGRCGSSVNPLA